MKPVIIIALAFVLLVPITAFGEKPVSCVGNTVSVDYGKKVLVYGLIESDSDPIFIDNANRDSTLTFPKDNYNFILIKAITGGVIDKWKLTCTKIIPNTIDIKNFEMVQKMTMYSKIGKLQIITPEYITVTNNSFEIKGQLKSSMAEYPPVKIQLMREIQVQYQYMGHPNFPVTKEFHKIGCIYSDQYPIQKDGTFHISGIDVDESDIICQELSETASGTTNFKNISNIKRDSPTSANFYLILTNVTNLEEWAQYVLRYKIPPTDVLFMNSETFPLKISKVPEWVKNYAKWWADGTVDDSTFTEGIGFLIKEKIIGIASLPEQASDVVELKVPEWIKNNAGWWADGMISEDDFIKGIKYLVEKGIIKVD